jgi:hypothetical protein
MRALNCVKLLNDKHPSYVKTFPMKIRLFKYWLNLPQEKKLELIKDEATLKTTIQEIMALGCPASASDLEAMIEKYLDDNRNSIEFVHEYMKLKMKLFG